MKKFLNAFLLVFSVTFGLLNYRFLLAQGQYYFASLCRNCLPVKARAFSESLLPISSSRTFFLEIPSLQITAPIILEKSTDPQKIYNDLTDGVVHYADTPLPGKKGTAIILGHSSAYPWYKGHYGSVFALLGHLQAGDSFNIYNGDQTYTYQVSGSEVFNPFDHRSDQFQQIETTSGSSVLLVSCWPVGTDYKRIAVKGDLVK